jgi:cob(I)alamin adenosyltransferase
MNSITTTLGDRGETSLLSGERASKDHPRVEAVGELDELSACLGDAKCAAHKTKTREVIETVQNQLIGLMGALAFSAAEAEKINAGAKMTDHEKTIRAWAAELEEDYPMQGFTLPGFNPGSAKIHIARTVCRRAERRIVTLNRRESVCPAVLRYINRLSDLLYLLARSEEDQRD